MIDFHTHTLLSDGVLLPAELLRRYEALGIKILAFADHVDHSNIDWVVPRLVEAVRKLGPHTKVKLIPACELTHIPLDDFKPLAAQARKLGARLVLGHGETVVEPVKPGTNRAAILAGVDILAHPGLIKDEDARLAKEKGVFLEISARAGHSLANGHVARAAEQTGARLVFSTDAHEPGDLCSLEKAGKVLRGAGLTSQAVKRIFLDEKKWVEGIIIRKVKQ
ncbi:MAG: histidinol phosphate phosphatase domain-containing protein [Candidatus Omnitrophica bacterium]|nr:histidinol phosphate phosphatase domain-containing protein [Candidatus Omnitrophota bacterium]